MKRREPILRVQAGVSHAVCALILFVGCGFALADMPVKISDNDENWFQTDAGEEIIFVGELPDSGTTDISLGLKRDKIDGSIVTFWIQTDAQAVGFSSGETSFNLPVDGDFDHPITLSGKRSQPAVYIGDMSVPAVRGRWVRMLFREQTPIEVNFQGASYVNMRFAAPGTPQMQPPMTRTMPAARPDMNRPNMNPTLPSSTPPTNRGMVTETVTTPVPVAAAAAAAAPIAGLSPTSPGRTIMSDAASQVPVTSPSGATAPENRSDVKVLRQVGSSGAVTKTVNSGEVGPNPTPENYENELFGPNNAIDVRLEFGTEFPTAYFYRGFGRENQGLIVRPFLGIEFSFWRGNEERDGTLGRVINEISAHVDLVPTFSNGPFGFESTGEAWAEVIFKAGGTVRFFERFEFLLEYENVESIRESFRDVHQANFGLSFDDSDPTFPTSFQPYVLVSWELEKESDGGWLSAANNNNPLFQSGWYLEVGIRPEFDLVHLWLDDPVTVSFPILAGFSILDYYQDPSGKDDFFGYASVGAMFQVPLFRVPATGNRSVACDFSAGIEVLILGASARRLSQAVGTGDSTVVPIGKFAISFSY